MVYFGDKKKNVVTLTHSVQRKHASGKDAGGGSDAPRLHTAVRGTEASRPSPPITLGPDPVLKLVG